MRSGGWARRVPRVILLGRIVFVLNRGLARCSFPLSLCHVCGYLRCIACLILCPLAHRAITAAERQVPQSPFADRFHERNESRAGRRAGFRPSFSRRNPPPHDRRGHGRRHRRRQYAGVRRWLTASPQASGSRSPHVIRPACRYLHTVSSPRSGCRSPAIRRPRAVHDLGLSLRVSCASRRRA